MRVDNPIETAKTAPKLKWNDETRTSFKESLKSESTKNSFERIIDDQVSPEKTISDLTSILKKCASIEDTGATSIKKIKIRETDRNKPWFDHECKKLKRKIKRTGGKLKHDPHNVSLRQNLFFEKRNFKI